MSGEEPEYVQDDKRHKTRTGHASDVPPREGCGRFAVLLQYSSHEKRESAYRGLLLVWKTGNLREGERSTKGHFYVPSYAFPFGHTSRLRRDHAGEPSFACQKTDDEHVKEKI